MRNLTAKSTSAAVFGVISKDVDDTFLCLELDTEQLTSPGTHRPAREHTFYNSVLSSLVGLPLFGFSNSQSKEIEIGLSVKMEAPADVGTVSTDGGEHTKVPGSLGT